MLLVVYSHIQAKGYHNILDFNLIFVKFRMPLFFFISGWVLYKHTRRWDVHTSIHFLINKFKVQILSTLIFFFIFIYIYHIPISEAFGSTKTGYWFTYTLFFFFLFYVVSVNLGKLFGKIITEDSAVLTIAILITFIYCFTAIDSNEHRQNLYNIVGVTQWKYYIFFCFGTFTKKYFNSFVSITNPSWVMAFTISSFFILLIFNDSIVKFGHDTILFFLYGFIGIVFIFTFFRKNEHWFATNKNISKWLQYIGRHTLDIYLLHYFFLPRNLQAIGDFFIRYSNPTIELFVSMTLALIVICVCLLLSKMLCTSPLLGNILFGKTK